MRKLSPKQLGATIAVALAAGGAVTAVETGGDGNSARRGVVHTTPTAPKVLGPESAAIPETILLNTNSTPAPTFTPGAFSNQLMGSNTSSFLTRITPAFPARRIHLRSSQIAVEFNSFVIGNVPPTPHGKPWTGVLQGPRAFSRGPGNWKGAYYQYAYIYGPKDTGFNGCGWLQEGRWKGRSTLVRAQCPWHFPPGDPRFITWFRRSFTDGHIFGGPGDGAWAHLDFNAPGCTQKTAFYNARPWLRHERGLIALPIRTKNGKLWVKIRYITKSGQFVVTHVPRWSTKTANWPFIPKKCFDGKVRSL